jgi:hypothetical protein
VPPAHLAAADPTQQTSSTVVAMATTVNDVVAIRGEVAGTMVHVVQHVDLRSGRTSVAHHLPIP